MPRLRDVKDKVSAGLPYLTKEQRDELITAQVPLQIHKIGERVSQFKGRDREEFLYTLSTMKEPNKKFLFNLSRTPNREQNVEELREIGFPITDVIIVRVGKTDAMVFEEAPENEASSTKKKA